MGDKTISDGLKDLYGGYYNGPSEWRRLGAVDKAENIITSCGAYPHDSVLEIGAGDGSVLKALAEKGFGDSLYAIEVSESAIEAIQSRGIRRLRECRLYDGYNIPYGDVSFDLVVLSHVVEHLEHPAALLDEAARVARYVFVEVPLEKTSRFSEGAGHVDIGHINFYSEKTIRQLVEESGFKVLSQKVTNPSRRTYVFREGGKGFVKHLVKHSMLRLFPSLATRTYTYNCSMLLRKL